MRNILRGRPEAGSLLYHKFLTYICDYLFRYVCVVYASYFRDVKNANCNLSELKKKRAVVFRGVFH